MKKIFLLSIIMLTLSGCTSINNLNIDKIINDGLNSNKPLYNTLRKGYRYYLPKGLILKTSDNFNEVITDNQYTYYLYVDIVSYHNKTNTNYEENPDAYYSKRLENGLIEVNYYQNNKYLIVIINNYAKIEVIINRQDLAKTLAYAIAISSSITYNDSIISNYLSSKEFTSIPEEFNIFEVVNGDNYLEFSEDSDNSSEIKDPDYIK